MTIDRGPHPLLCGSEGTLAVVTRARLRLVAPAGSQAVALVGLASTADALTLLAAARAGLGTVTAAEIFFADGLALVRAAGGLPAPFAAEFPAYVVLECAARTDPTDELLELLSASDVVGDATVASDLAGQARLWAYRETHTESIGTVGRAGEARRLRPARRIAGARRRPAAYRGRRRSRSPRRLLRTPQRGQPPRQRARRARPRGGGHGRRARLVPRSAAASAPNTASAGPRRRGCTCPARPPRSRRCGG